MYLVVCVTRGSCRSLLFGYAGREGGVIQVGLGGLIRLETVAFAVGLRCGEAGEGKIE